MLFIDGTHSSRKRVSPFILQSALKQILTLLFMIIKTGILRFSIQSHFTVRRMKVYLELCTTS